MSRLNRTESELIPVYVSSPVMRMLEEAARAVHKPVGEFLHDAGVAAAARALADRGRFVLDEAQWTAFQAELDRPVRSKLRLKKLLREPGPLG